MKITHIVTLASLTATSAALANPYNVPVTFNDTTTFNGEATFNDAATFVDGISIGNGQDLWYSWLNTGGTTQSSAMGSEQGGIHIYSNADESASEVYDGGVHLSGTPVGVILGNTSSSDGVFRIEGLGNSSLATSLPLFELDSATDTSVFRMHDGEFRIDSVGSAYTAASASTIFSVDSLNSTASFDSLDLSVDNGSLKVDGADVLTSSTDLTSQVSGSGFMLTSAFASELSTLTSLYLSAGGEATFSNPVLVESTAPSTSSTTGALVVDGGLGVATDSYINGIRIGKGLNGYLRNTAFGDSALSSTTSGDFNTALGHLSQKRTNSGVYNTSIGASSLHFNKTGWDNTAVGVYSLYASTGSRNSSLGSQALFRMSSGSNNIAIGHEAGHKEADGSTNLTTANNCIFIGTNSRGDVSGMSNAIVIGTSAISGGSNTTVIGTASTTTTRLHGETDTDSLKVQGDTLLEGDVILSEAQGDISMGAFGSGS